jgi:hypothetical protein
MERRKTERSEGSNGRAGVEVMLKGVLFVRRWRGGELDRVNQRGLATHTNVPAHLGYAATCARRQGYVGV